MKIKPADKFILGKVAQHGEVVLILGQRRSESATRAQVMEGYRITGNRLSRHSTLPRAYVYTPIEDFTTDDVWTYLLSVPSPWGGENRDLASLYRSAQSGECPLVVDLSTPSCGGSRFGCWVCTVVERDRSMEAMIDNGEEWMAPMLDFRDFLAEAFEDTGADPARAAGSRSDSDIDRGAVRDPEALARRGPGLGG
jgi:DNA sulfur modification protein DndC